MPIVLRLPALSPTMEQGSLKRWLVAQGTNVRAGDIVAEVETDKAVMEVEAADDGVVGKLLIADGTEDIAVNTPMALLLEPDEDPSVLEDWKDDAPVPPSGSHGPSGTSSAGASPSPSTRGVAGGSEPDSPKVASMEPPLGATEPVAAHVTPVHRPLDESASVSSPSTAHYRAAEEVADHQGSEPIAVRFALRDAMAEEMRRDPTVLLMGEEVAEYQGAYKVTQGLLQEFGASRVKDTPITEAGFTGVGVGAAFAGLRPIVEFMTFNFAMQAIDQIVNSAAKTLYMSGGEVSCPIVFRGPNGAAARVGAQHSQNFAAWYAQVPGLYVVAPYSASDAKGLLKAAIRNDNPVIVLENELLYGNMGAVSNDPDALVEIGRASVVRRGRDVTLVSYSIGVKWALDAADALRELDIEAEVIDLRSLRPLDIDAVVESVGRTHRLVVIEEGWPVCGIASEVCAQVTRMAFDELDAPPLGVSGKDVPMPYAENLEKLALPAVEDIVSAVKSVCYL